MRRYLLAACGLVIVGAAYLGAQSGGADQKGAPPEALLRETVAKLRAGRIATPTNYDRLNAEQKGPQHLGEGNWRWTGGIRRDPLLAGFMRFLLLDLRRLNH